MVGGIRQYLTKLSQKCRRTTSTTLDMTIFVNSMVLFTLCQTSLLWEGPCCTIRDTITKVKKKGSLEAHRIGSGGKKTFYQLMLAVMRSCGWLGPSLSMPSEDRSSEFLFAVLNSRDTKIRCRDAYSAPNPDLLLSLPITGAELRDSGHKTFISMTQRAQTHESFLLLLKRKYLFC